MPFWPLTSNQHKISILKCCQTAEKAVSILNTCAEFDRARPFVHAPHFAYFEGKIKEDVSHVKMKRAGKALLHAIEKGKWGSLFGKESGDLLHGFNVHAALI
jgi:hypothetical protein